VKVIHTLTREEPPLNKANVIRGRIDAAMLRETIPDPSSCIVYACGPAIGPFDKAAAREKGVQPTPRFLETVLSGLAEVGVAEDRIEYESYG
jgi:ferredoxin-NADP reductase